jgi:hypothetical protein
MSFGQLLRQLRLGAGLTQEGLVADALALEGLARAAFDAAARGRL